MCLALGVAVAADLQMRHKYVPEDCWQSRWSELEWQVYRAGGYRMFAEIAQWDEHGYPQFQYDWVVAGVRIAEGEEFVIPPGGAICVDFDGSGEWLCTEKVITSPDPTERVVYSSWSGIRIAGNDKKWIPNKRGYHPLLLAFSLGSVPPESEWDNPRAQLRFAEER